DGDAVYRDACAVGLIAEDGDVHRAVEETLVIRRYRHPGCKERQLQERASVERQFLNLLALNYMIDGVPLAADQRGNAGDGHNFFLLAYLQMDVRFGHSAGCDVGLERGSAKSRGHCPHLVGPCWKQREAVMTGRIGFPVAQRARTGVSNADFRV